MNLKVQGGQYFPTNMKSEKQFNEEKEIIREGLITLLKQNFEGLSSYQIFLENERKGEIKYLGRKRTEEFILDVKRDSYKLLEIMKRTGYFIDKELKRLTREYSDLDEKVCIARQGTI